jgi:uncharacterized protein YyaL (SSP411 family)
MTGTPDTDSNRLATASSPYLHQHADNPVHWQPWDDIALSYARQVNKPILLSIGYSACHWCHVMAHGCFENPDIAAVMNRSFVSIKLDREERPDIDQVYQLAHQALTGRGGGWPLTAFLDPEDLSPFYIGTYFPPQPQLGLPGFAQVLAQVKDYFDTHRDDLRAHASRLHRWFEQVASAGAGGRVDAGTVSATALERIQARFDPNWGGNAGAPKFPRARELEWLLDQPNHRAQDMAGLTLATMAARGLQDHIGGGFFRYCVDPSWTIPHFEKMLYDNAQLLPAYARSAVVTHANVGLRDIVRDAALGIADWLEREMTAPNGAFYSSLDADSAGGEGRFYLWTREEVRDTCDDTGSPLIEAAFGLDAEPNFEGRAWHLLRAAPTPDLAAQFHTTPQAVAAQLEHARRRLFEARASRPRPTRDDKILTSWNSLTISGLARTARLLDDDRCARMAQRALAAVREAAWIDSELYANAAQPDQRIPGFLDDYALLLEALLETLQFRFRLVDLDWAIAVADSLLTKFEDPAAGGFWFSAKAHTTPLARTRGFADDALPNGNGVAIQSLLRLGHLLGRSDYLDAAERALDAASGALAQHPDACPTLLRALDAHEHPHPQIVIRCDPAQHAAWQAALADGLRSAGIAPGAGRADVFIIDAAAGSLPGLLAERNARDSEGTAWICQGTACRAPVTDTAQLASALREVAGDA